MKNTKENAEINAAFGVRSIQHFHKGIEPRKFSGAMPSPMELATLAATLASGPDDNPVKLCASALKLWFASHEAITLQQQCNEDHQQLEADRKARLEPPEDQEWPITLQDYCRIAWPDRDTGERAAIIRQWLKDDSGATGGISYAKMNSWQIDKGRFDFLGITLIPWYQRWKLKANSAEHSEAAKISWQDCNAEIQKTPEYQEYKTECEKLGRKTSKRGFTKWLKDKKKTPFKKLAALVNKKIILPS
jgi:hypothetical protein